MSKYWNKLLHQLVPYVPGEQPRLANLVKLNTNENPFPPSPRAIAAMQQILQEGQGDQLRLYPDPDSTLLKESIARYYGIDKNNVFVGNGSDEVLAHIFHGYLKQDKPVLFPDITYSFYTVYCGLYGISYQQVPLTPSLAIDLKDYSNDNGGIIFPNPNAPTGVCIALHDIEQLLKRNTESVVVIDEAYIDFGGESAISLIKRYPQLLVTQTLSKSRSLAGLRVGLAIGDAALIEGLERIKNSFNSYPLGRMAIAGAAAAFDDVAYFRQTTAAVIQQREQLTDRLQQIGFRVLPSTANFIFIQHPVKDARSLMAALRERSVIVRHFGGERISNYLRITIGSSEQNKALLTALQEIL